MEVALCTPFHDQVRGEYADSLARMLMHSLRRKPDLEIRPFLVRSFLPDTHDYLASQALDRGAGWTLWIDSDQ